jgi:hypothetical protein
LAASQEGLSSMKLVMIGARNIIFNKNQFPNSLHAHQKLLKLKITDLISSDKLSPEMLHVPVQRPIGREHSIQLHLL